MGQSQTSAVDHASYLVPDHATLNFSGLPTKFVGAGLRAALVKHPPRWGPIVLRMRWSYFRLADTRLGLVALAAVLAGKPDLQVIRPTGLDFVQRSSPCASPKIDPTVNQEFGTRCNIVTVEVSLRG
jgi:hypothetical protein